MELFFYEDRGGEKMTTGNLPAFA